MTPPRLQPLRIPAGWRIDWNTLEEVDPGEEPAEAFGGSSVFLATNEGRRFQIDVEWRPEFDPEGNFYLRVEYAPWERTERGRRRNDVPLHFRDAEVVHRCETRSQAELVRELEVWLWRCATWMREGH
jgi:hypothetical protein